MWKKRWERISGKIGGKIRGTRPWKDRQVFAFFMSAVHILNVSLILVKPKLSIYPSLMVLLKEEKRNHHRRSQKTSHQSRRSLHCTTSHPFPAATTIDIFKKSKELNIILQLFTWGQSAQVGAWWLPHFTNSKFRHFINKKNLDFGPAIRFWQ